ncbi:MAG: UvrD-helicase domain-containing protein, partial [Holophagales bacterium]|nr:UvrD-helicase domain-containing protein [Holophagales bacterium]
WRRHPNVRFLPQPPPLERALRELESARRCLAACFDRARTRVLMRQVRWKKGTPSERQLGDRTRLEEMLAAAEAFLATPSSDPSSAIATGLWALRGLDPARLRSDAFAKDVSRIDELTGHDQLEELLARQVDVVRALRLTFVERLHEAFEAAKRESGSLAFDDLLHRLRDALADRARGPRLERAVRGRFRAALIDEFQDTDLVQYEIFQRLFAQGPLFLVGDPKQAIYRFRGADIFAYLSAARDADRTYTLDRNWRSGRRLVAAVNGVFGGGQESGSGAAGSAGPAFVFDEIPFRPVDAAPAVAGRDLEGDSRGALCWWWPGEISNVREAEARIRRAVAAEVVALLDGGVGLVGGGERAIEPGDVAVLVRTNAQALEMQQTLAEAGIPAVVSRSGDIFASDEMEELRRLLEAVLDPSALGRLRAACATLAWGDTAAELDALGRDDHLFQERIDAFAAYRAAWLRDGFMAMAERLIAERSVRRRLLALEGGERRLTNLFHALEICQQASHELHLSPAGLVSWIEAERRAGQHDRDAAELRLESDARAVSLTTVHKSKGLQYEVVFCPFLWKTHSAGEPPVLAHVAAREVVYDHGSEHLPHHAALAEAERLAEDLRLAYVALTRAKRRCYVAWGAIGRGAASARSALAYLLHRGASEAPEPAERVARALDETRSRSPEWLQDLRRLVDRHRDSMSLTVIEPESADGGAAFHRRSEAAPPPALAARTFEPRDPSQLRAWRISSFSSLARSGARRGPEAPVGPAPEPPPERPDRGDPTPSVAALAELGPSSPPETRSPAAEPEPE